MFLYARIYWLAEFGDVSCLQFNYLRVETLTLTATWEDFVGRFCRTILRATLSSSPTKLCVRPESMIVDTLGGICILVMKGHLIYDHFVFTTFIWFRFIDHGVLKYVDWLPN